MCVFVYCASLQALGPYSVSKTALLGLTRALAPELAQSNIRVNCVAPGVIKTRFSNAVRRGKKHTQFLFTCFFFIYFVAFKLTVSFHESCRLFIYSVMGK